MINLSSEFTSYKSNLPNTDIIYQLRSDKPLTSFIPASITASSVTMDPNYDKKIVVDSYDNYGNVTTTRNNDMNYSYIWDYRNAYPIAKVRSASQNEIAYTSFEAEGKGNWVFSGTSVIEVTAPTGRKAYNLLAGNLSKAVTSTTSYTISYWRPISLSALTITGTRAGYPVSGRTVNGWKYYEHQISGQTNIILTGSGLVDEVRLYPAIIAQMTTYTYDPLIGVTSQCDANNRIAYYEYDEYQRLILVRDQDRNILKKICYNYAGQTGSCSLTPVSVALTSVNYNGSGSGFTATYTNVDTGTPYGPFTFSIVTYTPQPLGSIPAGNYNLTIVKPGNSTFYTFGSGCGSMSTDGTSATFFNVNINTTTCNSIWISNIL